MTAAKDQKAEVQPASTTPKDPKTPAQGEDLPDSADVPTPSKGKNLSKGRKNLSGEE